MGMKWTVLLATAVETSFILQRRMLKITGLQSGRQRLRASWSWQLHAHEMVMTVHEHANSLHGKLANAESIRLYWNILWEASAPRYDPRTAMGKAWVMCP